MANNGGLLQAKITIPATYQIEITEVPAASATVTVFVASNTGYWTLGSGTLLANIGTLLTADATLAGTYTASLSATTGQVTITATGITSFTIDSMTAGLQTLMGFTGAETGTLSYTGENAAMGVWIPDCPTMTPFAVADTGWHEYDASSTQAPDGTVVSTAYNRRTALALEWRAVTAKRVRATDETIANESYQSFYDDCIFGNQTWFQTGGPVRWAPDRTSTSSAEYKIPVEQRSTVAQHTEGWAGLYSVSIPRLVKVP